MAWLTTKYPNPSLFPQTASLRDVTNLFQDSLSLSLFLQILQGWREPQIRRLSESIDGLEMTMDIPDSGKHPRRSCPTIVRYTVCSALRRTRRRAWSLSVLTASMTLHNAVPLLIHHTTDHRWHVRRGDHTMAQHFLSLRVVRVSRLVPVCKRKVRQRYGNNLSERISVGTSIWTLGLSQVCQTISADGLEERIVLSLSAH